MARKQHNELTAGIFTLAATVLLVGVVFWLGGIDLFKPDAQTAWFYIDVDRGLQGLLPGAQVKITDVEVGKIADVKLDIKAGKTYYVVELFDENTKVYSNARASVSAALVGGGATLQILDCGGGAEAQVADQANAAEIERGLFDKAETVLGKVDKEFDKIGKQVTDLLKTISTEMDQGADGSAMFKIHAMMNVLEPSLANIKKEMDSGNKLALLAKLHETIGSLQRIASDAEPKVSSVLTRVDSMVKATEPKLVKLLVGADELVGGAGELVDNLNKLTKNDIASIIKLIHQASEHVVKIGGNFAKLSEGAESVIAVNRENVDEIIDNMGQVASNLKSASKEIRRNPWRLLYRPKAEEERSRNIHDAARSFSNGAAQLDQALAKLKGLAAANPKGIPAGDPELKKIADQIKQTFDKFTDAEKSLWKELIK
jgi:ABC-type transporter Mla subunit MlaD